MLYMILMEKIFLENGKIFEIVNLSLLKLENYRIKLNFNLFDYDDFSSHLESEFSLLMIGEKEKEDEVLVEEEVLEGT